MAEREEDEKPDLEGWMKEYGTQLLRLNFLYLKDLQLAEDITQETFIKAYQNYNKFKKEASVKTWLTRIAINLCKDQRRKTWFKKVDCNEYILELMENTENNYKYTGLTEYIIQKEKNKELIKSILNLSVKNREIILMYYYQQFTINEISKILKLPEGTISSRLKRAREQLAKQLKGGWKYEERD